VEGHRGDEDASPALREQPDGKEEEEDEEDERKVEAGPALHSASEAEEARLREAWQAGDGGPQSPSPPGPLLLAPPAPGSGRRKRKAKPVADEDLRAEAHPGWKARDRQTVVRGLGYPDAGGVHVQ
jgi:hypothetical protein